MIWLHKSEWIEPVSSYRGYDVWELPPNGQGIATLQILNILEQYDIKSMGFGSAEYMHLFIEAKKLHLRIEQLLRRPRTLVKVPYKQLISKEYAKERAKLINLNKSARSYDAGVLQTGNTIYLTAADSEG